MRVGGGGWAIHVRAGKQNESREEMLMDARRSRQDPGRVVYTAPARPGLSGAYSVLIFFFYLFVCAFFFMGSDSLKETYTHTHTHGPRCIICARECRWTQRGQKGLSLYSLLLYLLTRGSSLKTGELHKRGNFLIIIIIIILWFNLVHFAAGILFFF